MRYSVFSVFAGWITAMSELDLNLLYVVVALDEKRSVSGAALLLHKSQPAVSASLARLRQFFDDPLFIRSGNNMQPTPRAASLIESARSVLGRIRADIVATPTFHPGSSDRTITLALSDVGEIVLLPTIMKELRRLAPRASLRSVSLPANDVASGLEAGEIDLAIGYFPDLKKSNFFQQVLFTDGFSSLLRSDHSVTASKLSLKQYLQLEHAVVRAESRTEEVIERFLARRKIRRRIALTTPHFASVPMLVAQSDLLVTVPEPLANYFSSVSAHLRVVGLPFELPRIDLKQFWHRKFHHDERNSWLRALVYGLFQDSRRKETVAGVNRR
jgi:DNA-binding transcriptional LysR family regulator